MSDAILEAALGYHEAGFCVLPVTKDKTPYVRWEQYQERWRREGQTRQDVEYLFDCPEVPRYGVAIITHPYSPLVALDFDGPCAAVAWEKTGIELPETATNYSQSGCPHLFFRPPKATDGLKRSIRLAKEERPCGWKDGKACGVDLICNGYIVVPPTPGYKEDTDHPFGSFADLPAAIFDLIKRPGSREERDEEDGAPIFGGHRNNTLTSLAGSMRRRGMGEAAIFKALLEENAERCRPPLPEAEVRDIAKSVSRYEPVEDATQRAPSITPVSDWVVWDAADYRTWKVEPVQWAIESIIPKDTIGYVGGLPKIGKSLLICDMLLHVMHKKPWLGRYSGGWTPRTLYLAREDPLGRIQARIDEMQAGYNFPPIPQGMFRLLIRERFQLTEPGHIKWLISFCHGEGIEFLILDVLGRMIRGKDQMDPKDWGEIQDIIEALNREHGLTVSMLDHARKPPDAKRGITLSAMEIKGPVEKYGGADWSMVIGRTKEKGRLEIITEGKDTDERLHFLVDVAPMARRKDEGWEIRQPDGSWQPGTPGPKFTYAGDVAELAEGRRETGRKNREAVYAVIDQRMQIGAILERLERAGHKLSRSTVGAHLKALVEEGRLDSSGEGRNAWYWRRE